MSETYNPQSSTSTKGFNMTATIDTALTAVYAAIERETANCNDGSILAGLAELVVALNDVPVVPTVHDTGIVGYADQASA